jgi:hypothetical protein
VLVGTGVFVDVGVSVGVDVGTGVGVPVIVGVRVGIHVEVGVEVGKELLVVRRSSSNTWSKVLERKVKLVTGFVQPVTRMRGEFPEVVMLTSGFPALLKVKRLLVPELTRILFTMTGRGKRIVPCGPPFVI